MKTIALSIVAFTAALASDAVAQVAKQITSLPAIITKPGRYVLSKDLVLKKVAAAAIAINVDDVKLDLGFGTISDNTVTGTVGASGHSYGIFGSASAGVIEGNRIMNEPSSHGEVGIRLGGAQSALVENNRICGFITGTAFTPGAGAIYRDNLTTNCTTKYTLGTDAGNNK